MDALLLPTATPIFFGKNRESMAKIVWSYSCLESVAMVVTLWTATSGLLDDDYAFALSVIATVFVALKLCGTCYIGSLVLSNEDMAALTKEKSDLGQLLARRLWADAVELIVYSLGSLAKAAKFVFKDSVWFKFTLSVCCLFIVLFVSFGLSQDEHESHCVNMIRFIQNEKLWRSLLSELTEEEVMGYLGRFNDSVCCCT